MRRVVIGCVWAALGLLVILSIAGAFLGAARSKVLFNSVPLAVFWFFLVVLLVVGILAFQRLRRSPGLLAMHVGSLLVLGGAMWGSDAAHELRTAWFGYTKVPAGRMVLVHDVPNDSLLSPDGSEIVGTLPFSLVLKDFRVKRDEGTLQAVCEGGGWMTVPAETGRETTLGNPAVTVRIVKVFENLKVLGAGTNRQVVDVPGSGDNPALDVEVAWPDGDRRRGYLFPGYQVSVEDSGGLILGFEAPVKNYESAVEVLDGEEAVPQVVAVNRPLHWGGYHFYQVSYDPRGHSYTVFSVVSDSGLWAVYAGFILLVVGVFWQFWVEAVLPRITDGNKHGA
jgi:hypothetical protein